MEFQRLCYFRLGTTGDNAGYQLAAASSEITSAQAREFGQAVSRVSSVPEGFDAAEGTFSSGDKVYLSHVSMSSDVAGRLVPISSALVIGGAEWRQLLRQQPAWLLSLDRSVFFDTCPQGAYPGHPASVKTYPVKEDALPTPDMMALRRKFGLDDKARFKELLLCLYHCLFAPTEEKLFISLPQEKYSNDGGRELMACIYSALPAAIAAQLSYRIGLSPLPAQLTLGLSVNRHVFPNYVDLFPCERNQGTPMVKYTPISGLSFLDELIDATLSPEGPALLAKIDDFYAQLDPFASGSSAFSPDAEKGAKYLLCAAWLYASGISQRGEDREYFRSGTPSEGYTFLFLCKSIKHPGKDICEPVLAKLTELYALQPLDIQADAQGLQFDRKVVDEVSEQAWAFTASPDSPYEQAYFHLAERPERRGACIQACEQRPESPRHIRLRTHLVKTDDSFPSWPEKNWISNFKASLPLSEENEELIQARQKLSSLLWQKFYALEGLHRADLITAMLEDQQELSAALAKELGKEFLANQADSLCLIADDKHAFQCLCTLFRALENDHTALERLFLSKDEGRFAGLSDGHRAALYTELFTSEADIALKRKVLSDDAFTSLPEKYRFAQYTTLFSVIDDIVLKEDVLSHDAFASLSEEHRFVLYAVLFDGKSDALKAKVLSAQAFTSLTEEHRFALYAKLFSSAADSALKEQILSDDAFAGLTGEHLAAIFDTLLRPNSSTALQEKMFFVPAFTSLSEENRFALYAVLFDGKSDALKAKVLSAQAFTSLTEEHRFALYAKLFSSAADSALKEQILSDDAFAGLTEAHRVSIFNSLLSGVSTALQEKMFFVPAFTSLSEGHRFALYEKLFRSVADPALTKKILSDDGFTSLSDESVDKIYEIYLEPYPGDEAVSDLVFRNDRFDRLNPALWKNLLDLILTSPERGEPLADSLFAADLFCRLPEQARLSLFVSRITDERTSAESAAALLRSPARAGFDSQQQSELLSQILTRFVGDDAVVRQVFHDGCFDGQEPDTRCKQYRQVLAVRRPANRLCLDLINEQHLDGLDTQQFSALITALTEQLDTELLPCLLESPRFAQLPGESLLSSVVVLLDRAPQEKQKFFSSPLYSRLSSQQKLSLLERYADEEILSAHLDPELRNVLLSGALHLSPRLLQLCDGKLSETPGFAAFYMDYLEKVRFDPSDLEKAKQELQTAHKNNPALCRRFFSSVAQRNEGYGSWTPLADWYISSFAMPEERDIPQIREKQRAFQRLGLSSCAEILRQRIKAQALQELNSSKDPVSELPRLEQLLAEDPDFLPPLREAFWQRISVSDFDPDLLPFYQEHLPSSGNPPAKAAHFISMANDFATLRQGRLPESPEALCRIAVQGEFYGKDESVLGSLDAAARQRLSRTISDCLAVLPADELLSSPDLTVYRFCQGQAVDNKTLDLLFDWVEENHLSIDARWAEQSVLIQPVYKAFCKRCAQQQKLDENGGAGKTSGRTPWLIAGIAIAAVLLIAGACLFFLLRSRNADPAEETPAPEETAPVEEIAEETPSSEEPVSDDPVIEEEPEAEASGDEASAEDEASVEDKASVEDEASGEADIADEQRASADASSDTPEGPADTVSTEDTEAASSLRP